MSLAIIFYFLCTQHVSDINPLNAELNPICHLLALLGAHYVLQVSRIRVNISITRSLRLCCWITTMVVLFLFQPATRTLLKTNRTKSPTHSETRTERPLW